MIKIHNIIRNLSISLLCILLLYNASYKDLFNCHVFATLRQRTIPQKSQYVFANSTSSQTLSSVIIPPFHVSCCSLQPKTFSLFRQPKKNTPHRAISADSWPCPSSRPSLASVVLVVSGRWIPTRSIHDTLGESVDRWQGR